MPNMGTRILQLALRDSFTQHSDVPSESDPLSQTLSALSIKKKGAGEFPHGAVEMNLTGNHELAGSIPGLSQWVKALS